MDDIIFTSSLQEESALFKSQLREYWEISDLGTTQFALGITIDHNHENHTVSLSQTMLIDHIVEQLGQTDAYPIDTPMVAGLWIICPDKSCPLSK